MDNQLVLFPYRLEHLRLLDVPEILLNTFHLCICQFPFAYLVLVSGKFLFLGITFDSKGLRGFALVR